jgi:hypothetical protein
MLDVAFEEVKALTRMRLNMPYTQFKMVDAMCAGLQVEMGTRLDKSQNLLARFDVAYGDTKVRMEVSFNLEGTKSENGVLMRMMMMKSLIFRLWQLGMVVFAEIYVNTKAVINFNQSELVKIAIKIFPNGTGVIALLYCGSNIVMDRFRW